MLWDPNKDKQVEPILDKVGQLIWKAADYLEAHRWCRYKLYSRGAVCTLGALMTVDSGEKHFRFDYNSPLLVKAADRICTVIDSDIAAWNDFEATSKKEVIETLRKAAKLK